MKKYSGGVHLASVERSGFEESRHHGSIVVLSGDGGVIASAGDVDGPIFPRSSNKPFQAIGMLRAGLDVHAEDLSLVAASHSGEDFHLERVRALLDKAGLSEDDLRCPADWRLSQQCGEKKRVYMNCSGKHTGMLLTCVANGWTTEDYYEPGHPVQKALIAAIEDYSDEPVAAIGVDGCGAPVAAISLTGLATGFLRASNHEVGEAMRTYPEMCSGTGRADATLMRGVPNLFSKGGAEGVWAAAIPGVGAVAMKIDDGNARAHGPVMVSALERLGIEVAAPELVTPPVFGRGERVGTIKSLF
ncbi:MAG TPA: asparaginase [Candidatus Limnocylindrales bacterium]|nr:asparaginase [Candidatus Limnocylindrales bacterium]